jgi:iron(III) transport system substrate-binding protein
MKNIWFGIVFFILLSASSCQPQTDVVVVYCSVDQVFSEPILKDFEQKTGIKVKAVFDTEETKSTGVMNRLIAEKNNPQCDVFWSGDPIRNNVLKTKGVTAPYSSLHTELIPQYFKAQDQHWTGFSARARVLIFNKKLIERNELPNSILDLTQPKYKGMFGIANPLFGTTTFHLAALFSTLGDEKTKQWLQSIKSNGVVIATSNGDIKKRVMQGELVFGLTDTDDAFEARKESSEVDFIFLDQQPNGFGTLIMPNALSLIARSPNEENGKKLIDDLLTKETEAKLSKSCAQMPLIKGTPVPANVPSLDAIIPMKINYDATALKLIAIQPLLKEWVEN